MKLTKLLLACIILCISIFKVCGKTTSYNFVLVHGAWHGAWTWYELEYLLIKSGHTVINIDLPGHGIDTTKPANITLGSYQNAIVNVLDQLEEPAILVGHSMGGIAISMAAEARPAKVSKLVYLAAFLLQDGQSMFDLATADTESMILPALIVDPANMVIDLDKTYIRDIFYGESTLHYTILSEKLLRPEPLVPIMSPISISDQFNSVRRFYIETSYDMAITPPMQERMYTAMPCEEVYTLHSEHSPFFSMPDNLKNILLKIAKDENPLKLAEEPIVSNNEITNKIYNPYPNPTNGIITIPNPSQKATVYLLDLSGHLQGEYVSGPGNISIDLNNNATGQYILKIVSPGYTISKLITYVK